MIKEETLLLIQIDGQTNWTMNEPDLNQTKIGEYMGTVKNGLPHGQGQLCYSHGGKYIGSWKDGEKDGLGTYTYTNGRVSIGNYKNGKKNGNMKIKCPNGDTYQGDLKMEVHLENSFLPIQKERFLKLISRDSKILV